jgi:hypothetical protein
MIIKTIGISAFLLLRRIRETQEAGFKFQTLMNFTLPMGQYLSLVPKIGAERIMVY